MTINQFMTEFTGDRRFGNILSLVRTLDHVRFDNWETEPPVQPFIGCKDATDTELRFIPTTRWKTSDAQEIEAALHNI